MTYKLGACLSGRLGDGCMNWMKFIRNIKSSLLMERDHVNITSNQPRQNLIADATVIDMKMESPTVKTLTLKIDNPLFAFKAGQWVDFFIPNVQEVGGFSIHSSPLRLQNQGFIDLAIKFAKYPPAHWIFTQCKIGNKVQVRSGGEFLYDNQLCRKAHNLLLIGGGVGINPLASIYWYCADIIKEPQNSSAFLPEKVLLMYSASHIKELLFKEDFTSVSREIQSLKFQFFVTKEKINSSENLLNTRINSSHLNAALKTLGKENTLCYICGPAMMIADINKLLLDLGIDESNIKFEKWW